MNLKGVNLITALLLSFCQLLIGQSSLCSLVDELVDNSNSAQVDCKRRSCSSVDCLNQDGQLGRVVNLFYFRLLPCTEPPAVMLQLLGEEDLTNGGQRSVQLNTTLTESETTSYSVTLSGIVFGTYHIIVNSSSSSSFGIAVQLTTVSSSSAVSVIDYTHIDFDSAASSSCTMQTTTAQPTTSQQMDDVSNSTTDAIINGNEADTPTAMNTDSFIMQTSRDFQNRPTAVLNLVLALLTVYVLVTLRT